MTIWIVNIIKTLLLPQSSLPILAILGNGLWMRGRTSGLTILKLTGLTWYLLSTPFVTKILAKSMETYPAIQTADLNQFKAQAIVVIGGGIRQFAPEYAQTITVNYHSLERLRYAATLARLTHLPLLVSGGKVFDQTLPSEASAMRKALTDDFQVTPQWLEDQSRNTAENARFSYALLAKQQIYKIILVTHALHMPRAAQAFRDSGFEVLPAPTAFLADRSAENIFSFLPSVKAFMESTAVIHECMGGIWRRSISPVILSPAHS